MAKNNKQKEKTIKEIAGETLLFFYVLQRNNYAELDKQEFKFHLNDGIKLVSKNDYIEYSDSDLYNALRYLENRKFVKFAKGGEDNVGRTFRVIELTADGFDVIEGVVREDGEKRYNIIFNFNFDIEALLKLEGNINLDSIVKASLM